jgi:hypothetical protein
MEALRIGRGVAERTAEPEADQSQDDLVEHAGWLVGAEEEGEAFAADFAGA